VACNSALLVTGSQTANRALRPAPAVDDTVVKPFKFDQQLLLCNSYPSDSPMVVKKNGQEMLADEGHPIAFRECRYVEGRVQAHDKLDLAVAGLEVHGTFEVGDLPTTDAVLLLVAEKRSRSTLVGFQSFALPVSSNSKDAQLAVIDAFTGNASAAHLKVEDHITGKEEQTVSKRIEQLNFNRVYSVEEGTYDASVAELPREGVLAQSTKKVLKLTKHQNYVVLRTGDAEHFPESLVVFPADTHSAGVRPSAPLAFITALLAALAVLLA